MSALIISVILGAYVVINSKYVKSTGKLLNDMLIQASDFESQSTGDTIDRIRNTWESEYPRIKTSVSYNLTDKFGEILISLEYYYKSGNKEEYLRCVELAKDSLKEITRLEEFNFSNFF